MICKFKCRKKKFSVIRNKNKIQDSARNKDMEQEKKKQEARKVLGFGRVWINESMSNHYKTMHWKCRMLHKHKHIDSYWFFNGHLQLKVTDASNKFEITEDDYLNEAGIDLDISAFLQQFIKRR